MFQVSWRSRLRRASLSLLGALALAILPASAATAATYTVDDTADVALATGNPAASCAAGSSTCTLRAAVQSADAAGGASTITVPAGMYELTIPSTGADDPATGDLDIQSNITISGSGSSAAVIDANSVDRAFTVQSGGALAVSGLTIENGSPSSNSTDGGDYGGAIVDVGNGLSVTGVVFRDNAASDQGGAIWIAQFSASAVNIVDSAFLDNSTANAAGAIYNTSGAALNIDSDTFSNNSSYDLGGAIEATEGALNIQDSTFSGNASQVGGALRIVGSAVNVTVDSSTFTGNQAASGGGAIQNLAGALTADDDLFEGNSSGSGEGGAISLAPAETSVDGQRDEPQTFQGDEFDDNSAGQDGGALAWGLGALTIEGSSFVDNTTPQSGGAIAADLDLGSGSPGLPWTMSNTTLADNSATSGGGIWFNFNSIPLSWVNDTIAFNHAAGAGGVLQGGGVANAADATSSGGTGVANTLIAENAGGDCGDGSTPAATSDEFSTADAGHNLDSDGTCLSNGVAGDQSDASPALGQPADNGGPLAGNPSATETLQTVAEMSGSTSTGAGAGCETTDERGVSRVGPCDIGSYQAAAAELALTGLAPATATAGGAFEDSFTVSDSGPAPSTGTSLSMPLPTGMTAYAASPSQGGCTESSTLVTCALGNVGNGSSATVTLVLSDAALGASRLTATATNAQGGSSASTQTTTITTPASAQGGSSTTTETTTTAPPAATVSAPTSTVDTGKPTATTGRASKLATRTASLAGGYTVGSQTTLVFFQYGTSKSFGSTTNPGVKSESGVTSAALKNLRPNTTYHFRLVAINASGVAYGQAKTLKTKRAGRPSRK